MKFKIQTSGLEFIVSATGAKVIRTASAQMGFKVDRIEKVKGHTGKALSIHGVMLKLQNTITDKTIADAIARFEFDKKKIRSYWHRSKVWKQIEKYIDKCEPNDCAFIDKVGYIYHSRGTGGIQIGNNYTYPAGVMLPEESLRICFSVRFKSDTYDDDNDCDDGYGGSRTGMIDLPTDLFLNYTDIKFNAWLQGCIDDFHERQHDKQRTVMREAIEKNPALAKEILASLSKPPKKAKIK